MCWKNERIKTVASSYHIQIEKQKISKTNLNLLKTVNVELSFIYTVFVSAPVWCVRQQPSQLF